MLGSLHRLWETLGRWVRHLRAPAGGPTPDTKNCVATRRLACSLLG